MEASSKPYTGHNGNPSPRLPPVAQVIVTQMLWTRGTPAGEQGRGHPGPQTPAGDTPGDGGRGQTPGSREGDTHSPDPGPAPN